MPRYYTGFRDFAYKISGGTMTPLKGAQKLSFATQSASRELTMRVGSGAAAYSESVETGRTADLSIVQLPVSFLVDVLGYTVDENGVLTEGVLRRPVHFSLFYEVQTDGEPIRTQLYDVCCVRPNFDVTSMTNKPSVDIRKLKLIVNADLRNTKAYERSVSREDSAEMFNTWFGEVQT